MKLLPALVAVALDAAPLAAPAQSGHVLVLKSVRAIDTQRHTVTLPVHKGTANRKTVWYIVTDASDVGEATKRGLVFAPSLAAVGATATVTPSANGWSYPAAPDFSSQRRFVSGATGFPPKDIAPGATAPAAYSPFVKVSGSSIVYNAPIIASGDGPFDVTTHANTADRVLALDPHAGTVTLLLADGFADGKRVFYISTEASDKGAAAIERATYAPSIGAAPASARLPIYVFANGREQGLSFAALRGNLGEAATSANSATLQTPRNVLENLPAVGGAVASYDPLWDAYIGAWTPAAASANGDTPITRASDVRDAAQAHRLTTPDGKPFAPAGIAVNCPVIAIAT